MKMKHFLALTLSISFLASCHKNKNDDPKSKPVEFTSSTYAYLGSFDSLGRPNYLAAPSDVISANLLSFINTNLPDAVDLRKRNPDLLSAKSLKLDISQKSDVYITFVSEGTAYRDAIAFYTYPTGTPPLTVNDIKVITYVFPDAGKGTTLRPGDKVKIGNFNAGTSIGFILMQNAWDPSSKTLNNSSVHFCSDDALNPEIDASLKKHVVFINYAAENKVLIGFEDTDRTTAICDHDFQDVVIYATVTQ